MVGGVVREWVSLVVNLGVSLWLSLGAEWGVSGEVWGLTTTTHSDLSLSKTRSLRPLIMNLGRCPRSVVGR